MRLLSLATFQHGISGVGTNQFSWLKNTTYNTASSIHVESSRHACCMLCAHLARGNKLRNTCYITHGRQHVFVFLTYKPKPSPKISAHRISFRPFLHSLILWFANRTRRTPTTPPHETLDSHNYNICRMACSNDTSPQGIGKVFAGGEERERERKSANETLVHFCVASKTLGRGRLGNNRHHPFVGHKNHNWLAALFKRRKHQPLPHFVRLKRSDNGRKNTRGMVSQGQCHQQRFRASSIQHMFCNSSRTKLEHRFVPFPHQRIHREAHPPVQNNLRRYV
jgi:hypothetical protein